MRGQARQDWMKVIRVIKSIDNMRQVESAQNLINLYKIMHGLECDHKLLELELKFKIRELN